MAHNQPFFSARVPMRWAACTTMAVTAGLIPSKIPATTGTSLQVRYTHDRPIRMNSDGSTNRAPAITPPQVRCISQPM